MRCFSTGDEGGRCGEEYLISMTASSSTARGVGMAGRWLGRQARSTPPARSAMRGSQTLALTRCGMVSGKMEPWGKVWRCRVGSEHLKRPNREDRSLSPRAVSRSRLLPHLTSALLRLASPPLASGWDLGPLFRHPCRTADYPNSCLNKPSIPFYSPDILNSTTFNRLQSLHHRPAHPSLHCAT
jgi:hypothetical protein